MGAAAAQAVLPVAAQGLPGAGSRVQLSRLLRPAAAAQHVKELRAREAKRLCTTGYSMLQGLGQERVCLYVRPSLAHPTSNTCCNTSGALHRLAGHMYDSSTHSAGSLHHGHIHHSKGPLFPSTGSRVGSTKWQQRAINGARTLRRREAADAGGGGRVVGSSGGFMRSAGVVSARVGARAQQRAVCNRAAARVVLVRRGDELGRACLCGASKLTVKSKYTPRGISSALSAIALPPGWSSCDGATNSDGPACGAQQLAVVPRSQHACERAHWGGRYHAIQRAPLGDIKTIRASRKEHGHAFSLDFSYTQQALKEGPTIKNSQD